MWHFTMWLSIRWQGRLKVSKAQVFGFATRVSHFCLHLDLRVSKSVQARLSQLLLASQCLTTHHPCVAPTVVSSIHILLGSGRTVQLTVVVVVRMGWTSASGAVIHSVVCISHRLWWGTTGIYNNKWTTWSRWWPGWIHRRDAHALWLNGSV